MVSMAHSLPLKIAAIKTQSAPCKPCFLNCDNALQVTGRAEPYSQALLHPDQDRVVSIRESARMQVCLCLERDSQQYW